jgi:hypothetical protein
MSHTDDQPAGTRSLARRVPPASTIYVREDSEVEDWLYDPPVLASTWIHLDDNDDSWKRSTDPPRAKNAGFDLWEDLSDVDDDDDDCSSVCTGKSHFPA